MDVREKLVDIVCDAMEADGCIGHCNHPPCFAVERVVNALIAHGVTVQEWISASEPPKEDGRYNVYIADKVHACVDTVRFYKDGVGSLHKNVWARYDYEDGYYEVKHITHWMPLPTPPKGE